MVAATPASHEHASLGRVLDSVRYQILNKPSQQPAIRPHHETAGHESEIQPLGGSQRGELKFDLAHQLVDAKAGELGTQSAGIKARHVKQGTENFFNGFERRVDIVDVQPILSSVPLNQSCDVQSSRVQRVMS